MAGGDRERDVEEETRNQMMQNLFGDQSEDEEEADDDDDVVEVVDDDDDQRQEPPQQQQRHQELDEDVDDDEEDDARSHAHARSGGYHSVSPAKLPQSVSLLPPRDSDSPSGSLLFAGWRLGLGFVRLGASWLGGCSGSGEVCGRADLFQFCREKLVKHLILTFVHVMDTEKTYMNPRNPT
jgi:hypothetical protein